MALSRRQFFRRLWSPTEKTPAERKARCEEMETHVRTHLLPYDFSITPEQELELIAEVRATLEKTPDEELFSVIVRQIVEEAVDRKIQPWRAENWLRNQDDRLKEIRNAAIDYVSTFLNVQASPVTLEQLKRHFNISDPQALEAAVKLRIQEWVATVEDHELLEYDVFNVKDLVFVQLRTWCQV